jgi:hypothetical protein
MKIDKSKQKQLIVDIMNEDTKDGLYKQQTAVEWLIKQLRQLAFNQKTHLGLGDIRVTQGLLDELYEQAKEMEKEQIIDFTRKAVRKILDEDRQNPFNLEQYYQQKYGGNNAE